MNLILNFASRLEQWMSYVLQTVRVFSQTGLKIQVHITGYSLSDNEERFQTCEDDERCVT